MAQRPRALVDAPVEPDARRRPQRPSPTVASRPIWVPLLLALITVLAFLPTFRNDFVWDDLSNLTGNPEYRGLHWRQLRWMLTAVHVGHYIPLTWLSFGVDYTLWGMDPRGYHLTNLVLHAANVTLFYAVAWRLLPKAMALPGPALRLGAAVAALFFAIHPLRVESVAWATERRDVLAGLFFLLTVLLYLEAAEAPGARRLRLLAGSVGAYCLALLSKSMVMTTPAVLLLLDVYPLRRMPGDPRRWLGPPARRVWVEKAPFLVLSLGAALAALHAQLLVSSLGTYPWLTRLVVALYGFWFYVAKTAFPVNLSPLYEVPIPLDPLDPRFVASTVGVIGLSVALLGLRRRWPAGLAAWTYQLIVLAPVSGLVVRAGFQLAADRYSYLACLGWALLVGAAAGAVARAAIQGRGGRALARVAAAVTAVAFGVLALGTWRQVGVWRDSETLWRHAVAMSPDCALCHANLGATLLGRGAALSALQHFQRAVALRPDRIEVRGSLGLAFAALGMLPEAVAEYQQVIERRPDAVDVRKHLAVALLEMGRPLEAIDHLERARLAAPGDIGVHVNLGFAHHAAGRPEEAIRHFQRALVLWPEAPHARLGLVQAYLALGQTDLAREAYAVLRRLSPALASRLGSAFPTE